MTYGPRTPRQKVVSMNRDISERLVKHIESRKLNIAQWNILSDIVEEWLNRQEDKKI